MVYLSPPHLASASRPSYAEAYNAILAAHRRSPLTSASSVILLVAPDVDALCAARMLADLFKQDDVMHRIVPVSGIAELERTRDELVTYTELHTLILLNMGAILDLPSAEWFGDFGPQLSVHVVDSSRPQNLSSLFGVGDAGERIVIWDDGEAEKLQEERKAWEALAYEPEPDSDEDSEYDSEDDEDRRKEEEEEERRREEEEEEDLYGTPSGAARKRPSLGDGHPSPGKRRRLDNRPRRMPRDERERHEMRLHKHYMTGTWLGQSASGTIYILASVLERVDNDLLWLAILGLTYQYSTSRISRDEYDKYHSLFHDEVARLNPPAPAGAVSKLESPDDDSIRATEELRFMLFRHWTLYDAMYHSSYVASKLGIWKERGRKRLTGLLAKMGFSIPQTQQPYQYMSAALRNSLHTSLAAIAPEYGLLELVYPSFVRSFGYRCAPLSAADAVEALAALLDVARGVKMEVEVEGARNGGEWFGGGKVWDVGDGWGATEEERNKEGAQDGEASEGEKKEVKWWVRNFWSAFDALDDIARLRDALPLAMSLHRAIIRQGTSIIDKQDIKTMRTHRLVTLTQGPDLPLFAHPGVLSRLALWLVDALRDRVPVATTGKKRKSLPFVVACLDEHAGTYVVVGVTAALDFGDVRKNEFGLAFLDAKERCNARTRHGSFDTSVLEINKADLVVFLEALCEAMDGS